MNQVLRDSLREDYLIVDVCAHIWYILEHNIHHALESRGRVLQTERHHLKLICALTTDERRHLLASGIHLDLPIAREEVQGSEDSDPGQVIEEVLNPREWPAISRQSVL